MDTASDAHHIVAAYHSAEILDRKYLEQYPLDLSSEFSMREFVEAARAEIIIHSAAITDVDLCEREPKLPQLLNADATCRLVDAVQGTSARLLYISTDYVFDGANGPYSETDPTNPINVYGKTKLAGEHAVLSLAERATIIRSASFLGHGAANRITFAERMLETMRDDPPLKAVDDQQSNVTPVDELATGIMRIIEAGASGIWHLAHPDVISRYELGLLMAESAGIDSSHVQKVKYGSLARDAARPLNGGLKVERAMRKLGITFRPLAASVKKFLESM
jgi:dTDP-4-dehydrorhamnose reductase